MSAESPLRGKVVLITGGRRVGVGAGPRRSPIAARTWP